jgi:putative membrane protein
MSYLAIKALHLIFVICWFAGLFYIGRIFIYFKEAESKPNNEKNILQSQFLIMAKRLMYIILWPSVLLTSVFGWTMVYKNTALLELTWMKTKLILVGLLLIYVVVCQLLLNQMKNGKIILVKGLHYF